MKGQNNRKIEQNKNERMKLRRQRKTKPNRMSRQSNKLYERAGQNGILCCAAVE